MKRYKKPGSVFTAFGTIEEQFEKFKIHFLKDIFTCEVNEKGRIEQKSEKVGENTWINVFKLGPM